MAVNTTVVICLNEAFESLVNALSHQSNYTYHSEEELQLIADTFKDIIDSLLDTSKSYEQFRQKINYEFSQAGFSLEEIRTILDVCTAEIINKLTEILPHFNDGKKLYRYTYFMLNMSTIILSISS